MAEKVAHVTMLASNHFIKRIHSSLNHRSPEPVYSCVGVVDWRR